MIEHLEDYLRRQKSFPFKAKVFKSEECIQMWWKQTWEISQWSEEWNQAVISYENSQDENQNQLEEIQKEMSQKDEGKKMASTCVVL